MRWRFSLFLVLAVKVSLAQNLINYADECARRIAPIPAFDCRKGTQVLVTVDGQIPASFQTNMNCDRPALLPHGSDSDGQCVPYSRALVLVDDGKAQIAAICREKRIRTPDTYLYDEIDVISHSVTKGSTCWFEATAPDTSHPLDGRRVPPPNERRPPAEHPAAVRFWNSPEKTASQQCVLCHDSGPFLYSPFVAQTGQLPSDPLGKYLNDVGVAFQTWPHPAAISTPGNTCVGCHRIGNLNTCKRAIQHATGMTPSPGEDSWASSFPNSHWMPLGHQLTLNAWNLIYRESVEQLAHCCSDPKGAECSLSPIGK